MANRLAQLTISKRALDDFERELGKEAGQQMDKASRALVDNTLQMHGQMRRNILVDTGTARRATLFKFNRKNGRITEAEVGTYVNYASFIERYKAYFQPAFERFSKKLVNDLRALGFK